jgi:hypothetical protein
MEMRFISNSEVAAWLQCRKKYYYEYVLDLEPKKQSDAISKGVLYHAMLEQYYAGKSMGYSEEECREAAMEPMMLAAQSQFADMVELGKGRDLIYGYFDHYMENDERYKVYAVETKMKLDLSDEFALVGTIDLVWQDMEDGKFIAVDHKSSYNFWTDEQASISGQFVKYVAILRSVGLDVKGAMVNQIRTRPLKDPAPTALYQRAWVLPKEPRLRSVLKQHMDAGTEIMAFRSGQSDIEIVPIFDKYICSNCPFLPLCDSESNGAPIAYQIQADYQKRTSYGYNSDSELGHV